MTHVYYKYAIAAIIVYDLSRPATFASVLKVCAAVGCAHACVPMWCGEIPHAPDCCHLPSSPLTTRRHRCCMRHEDAGYSLHLLCTGLPGCHCSLAPQQWHKDVNEKVMLPNGEPVPVILLANKVRASPLRKGGLWHSISSVRCTNPAHPHPQSPALPYATPDHPAILLVPFALCLHQHDVCPAEIDKDKLDKFCQDHGFLAWFATSAKLNKNIGAQTTSLSHALHAASGNTLVLPADFPRQLQYPLCNPFPQAHSPVVAIL